jgi:hypothetical protein
MAAVRGDPTFPRYFVDGGVNTLTCRQGHDLPDRDALYDYRDRQGHPMEAEVTEVQPPSPVAGRRP